MLIETGISFSRPNDVDIAAEDGDASVEITIKRGDVVAAAARAACALAASWIDGSDVQALRARNKQWTSAGALKMLK